jgi:hypothetical protein
MFTRVIGRSARKRATRKVLIEELILHTKNYLFKEIPEMIRHKTMQIYSMITFSETEYPVV